MADCSEMAILLGAFGDGELTGEEMREVARHLAQCQGCEAVLGDYAALGDRVRATAWEPSLENFAESVQGRIERLRVPLRVRLERHLNSLGERWTASLALTSAALALGACLVFLLMPYARQYLDGSQASAPLASLEHESLAPAPQQDAQTVEQASDEPAAPAVISSLRAITPTVAVWSEPSTKTTVIWVPDEASGND